MLKDTFFSIKDFTDVVNGRTYRISLNDKHPIFQAHFAGNPIMPGTCVVQLIKELVSDFFQRLFFVSTVKNMKFLQAINPLESPEIAVSLTFTHQEPEYISVSSVLFRDDVIFSKSTLKLDNKNDS